MRAPTIRSAPFWTKKNDKIFYLDGEDLEIRLRDVTEYEEGFDGIEMDDNFFEFVKDKVWGDEYVNEAMWDCVNNAIWGYIKSEYGR